MPSKTHKCKRLLIVCVAAVGCIAPAGSTLVAQSPSAKAFPVARVRFEQNATDGDVEVVFEVTGGSEGLASLKVVSPDGRIVVDFAAPDHSTLGMRQFVFESPEPKDVQSLAAAYPEGEYTFAGATASGARFRSKASLRHFLPPTTSLVSPAAKEGVPTKGLKIAWTPLDDVTAYIVELEERGSPARLLAKLPAPSAVFAVPDGFLRANARYTIAVGTVAGNGNISYIETSFTMAADR
jgi:hypothetical protein